MGLCHTAVQKIAKKHLQPTLIFWATPPFELSVVKVISVFQWSILSIFGGDTAARLHIHWLCHTQLCLGGVCLLRQ